MPVDGNITTRGDSASEHTQNTWKSIGVLAARLVERNACHKGETAQAIAVGKFLAEYAEACRDG